MKTRFTNAASGRLDKLLSEHTKLSRKRAVKTIENGGVRVNGKRAKFASQNIAAGSAIEVAGATRSAEHPPISILHQDGMLVVADKPFGLPSQATKDGKRTHLYGLLCAQFPYVGLHHRLDTPASGLVLFTVNRRANKAIAEGFKNHTIGRHYRAVVVGDPGESGTWTQPIDGRPATTHFQRIAHNGGLSAISVTLETGRTHQIRVHCAAAGHPIVGDRRHGGSAGSLWARLALHAHTLRFVHPQTNETITVESPIPDDLQDLWRKAVPDETQPNAD